MVIAVVAFVIFDGKKLPELCKELARISHDQEADLREGM
jgi:Sec-independent protein translocase protein TatA